MRINDEIIIHKNISKVNVFFLDTCYSICSNHSFERQMRNHFDAAKILTERKCSVFDIAMKIHDSYVSYNSDSMENPSHPNYFVIEEISSVDEKYVVKVKHLGQEFFSNPLSQEELTNVICGGKLACGAKKFNTKEARYENRLAIAVKLLTHQHSEQ